MNVYSSITLIYNPKSTGPSQQMARDLKAQLEKSTPAQLIKLMPTKYAGHAEQIAYEAAKASKRALVISSSGDGGYHEVVNGLMKAQNEGAEPVAGLLPGGNANDHYRNVHRFDLVEAIPAGNTQRIDLLQLKAKAGGQTVTRYAHSYIGIGLSPKAAVELNDTKLNRWNEKWIVFRTLLTMHPVRLQVGRKIQAYDSVICSNVGTMSKVVTLSTHAKKDDGKFEVTTFVHRSKAHMVVNLLKASLLNREETMQTASYTFTPTKPLLVQLDGEVETFDAGTAITIDLDHHVLTCIV